tara:strand:- start:287 stop:814 length:528 start_codon:yes stop_codon:yes gene_type:complete
MPILTSQLFPIGDIKILQYIDSSIVTPSASTAITLAATADLTKTFIIMLGFQGNGSSLGEIAVRAELTDANTATFTRQDNASSSFFQALIVSSDRLVSLQYRSIITSGVISNTATISAVDATAYNVFLIPSNSTGSSSPIALAKAVLTNSTTVTALRNSATGASTTGVFILELRK